MFRWLNLPHSPKNLVYPNLREWILPDLSNTDPAVGTVTVVILVMGKMQSFPTYLFDCVTCDIPSVTLLGAWQDGVDVGRRIDTVIIHSRSLEKYNALLIPVFDMWPSSTSFECALSANQGDSGTDTLTGRIPVFYYW